MSSAMPSTSDPERVKEATDIVSFIGRYVKLKRAGRNFVGLCPFHQDSHPSFSVSPERQFWYCFGCNRGGDIFNFLMEKEGLDFPEALKVLAQQAGITLSYRGEQVSKDRKLRAQEALELAAKFYHHLLTKHSLGQKARDYLKKRQITELSLEKFQLGYAPSSWSTTSDFLRQRGFTDQNLLDAGLLVQKDNRRTYDRFRQRIMFTLRDHLGRCVGFSGRALLDEQMPKYLNSPETLLFVKNKFLYGLCEGKDKIRETQETVLVEGNLDIVTAHQHDIQNVVAPLGTGLTINQIMLLKRFADRFFICFDNDEAGHKATLRALEITQPQEVTTKVISLEGGQDLDEVLRKDPSLFTKLKGAALPAFDYLVNQGKQKFDLDIPEGKVGFLEFIASFWGKTVSPVTQQAYTKSLAETLEVEEKLIESDLQRFFKKQQRQPAKGNSTVETSSTSAVKDRQIMVCEHLIGLFLQAPLSINKDQEVKKLLKEFTLLLTDTPYLNLWENITKQIKHRAELDLGKLQKELSPLETQLLNLLILKSSEPFANRDDFVKELKKTLGELKKAQCKKKLTKLSAAIQKAEELGEEKNLKKLKKTFNQISKKLAG